MQLGKCLWKEKRTKDKKRTDSKKEMTNMGKESLNISDDLNTNVKKKSETEQKEEKKRTLT